MKFLIDTNILIPLEPTAPSERESATPIASRFVGLAMRAGYRLYVHPEGKNELMRDADAERRRLRQDLAEKYMELPDPPLLSERLTSELGRPPPKTNEWVDLLHLEALAADAADILVTEVVYLKLILRKVFPILPCNQKQLN